MAFGSSVAILNQLIISFELHFVSEVDYLMLRGKLESITNKLNFLRNFLIEKSTDNK